MTDAAAIRKAKIARAQSATPKPEPEATPEPATLPAEPLSIPEFMPPERGPTRNDVHIAAIKYASLTLICYAIVLGILVVNYVGG